MEHKVYCIPFSKTGYCKYGDTCKYSHIRINTDTNLGICLICNLTSTNPVYTNCNHEYCKNCVLKKNLTNCLKCKEDLHGIFYYKK